MIWIFWLYIVPMLFLLTFILPAKGMISPNIWNVLFIIAVFPVVNLITVLGVIWKICTVKDMQSYLYDPDVQKRMEKFEKEIDDIMNNRK